MRGILLFFQIYQILGNSLTDEFRVVYNGNCVSHGGNRFCRNKVQNSFCDNLENICLCLHGYVAVQESKGKLCKPALSSSRCQIDSHCTNITKKSSCHPGVGLCICPADTLFVVQTNTCEKVIKVVNNSTICARCQMEGGTCYMANYELISNQNKTQCACPHRTATSSSLDNWKGSVICSVLLVDIGEYCDQKRVICGSNKAECSYSQAFEADVCQCPAKYKITKKNFGEFYQCELNVQSQTGCKNCQMLTQASTEAPETILFTVSCTNYQIRLSLDIDPKIFLTEDSLIFIFGTRFVNNINFLNCKFNKLSKQQNRYFWSIDIDKTSKEMPCGIYRVFYLNGALFTFYVAIWNKQDRVDLLNDHLYELSCRLFEKSIDIESEIVSSQILDRSWINYGDQTANLYSLNRKKRGIINFQSAQYTFRNQFQKEEEIHIIVNFNEEYLANKNKKYHYLDVEFCSLVEEKSEKNRSPAGIIELYKKDFITMKTKNHQYKQSPLISFNLFNRSLVNRNYILVKCTIRLCEKGLWCNVESNSLLPKPNVEFEVLKKKLIIINTIQTTKVEFIDVHKEQFDSHKCPSFVCLTNIQVILIILTTSLISIFFIISLSILLAQIYKTKQSEISNQTSKNPISDYIDLKYLPDNNNCLLSDDINNQTPIKVSIYQSEESLENLQPTNQINLFNIITATINPPSADHHSTEIYV